MAIIDTAKELLRKGMALNDAELIEMANTLLDSATVSPSSVANEKEASGPSPVEVVHPQPSRPEASDFLLKTKPDGGTPRDKIPVNKISRGANSFIDDGKEHGDIETPEIELTRRREPSKKHKQVCQACNQTVEVLDIHRREFFTCDKCLSNKRR